jgi:hypothetical protein
MVSQIRLKREKVSGCRTAAGRPESTLSNHECRDAGPVRCNGWLSRLSCQREIHASKLQPQPRRAASMVAMSIFFISIIASNARLAAAGSESVIA